MLKLKLDQKIVYTFIICILFLLIVAGISFLIISNSTKGFQDYREMAKDTNLAGRVQANMLMVRMNVKDFIITASEKDVAQYKDYKNKTDTFLQDARKEIRKKERAQKLHETEEMLKEYENGFEQVIQLMNERNKIVYNEVGVIGPQIEQNLTKILRQFTKKKNSKGIIASSEAIRSLLLSRLYVMKFLDNNSQAAVDRVFKEKKSFDENMKQLHGIATKNELRLVKSLVKMKDKYFISFKRLVEVIKERNSITKDTLDRIGPIIASNIEEIKLDIKSVQDKIGPALQASNNRGVTIITIVAIIALFAGIIFVVSIRRTIANFAEETINKIQAFTQNSEQMASGNQDLSSRTQQQASSLEETASTLEEITSTIKQTADNASKANSFTSEAINIVGEGTEVSQHVQTAMDDITTSSNKIADIVDLVDQLAFQTNILAINAAIEAAKAGDQGKGFAVVAIEVRDLAQRSAEAAKEIKLLIDSSLEKVNSGSSLVKTNSEKLNNIFEGVQRIGDLMGEISSATSEQSSAVEQINKAVTELDSVTQENSSLVEEIASLAENMSADASAMNNEMNTTFSVRDSHREKSASKKNNIVSMVKKSIMKSSL